MQLPYRGADELRRAILLAASEATGVRLAELLGENTERAKQARKLAFYLARHVARVDLKTAAAMIGIGSSQAVSWDRLLRYPNQIQRLEKEIALATHLLATGKVDPTEYLGPDTVPALSAVSIRSRLVEIQWQLARAVSLLNQINDFYQRLARRERRLEILDRLIAAGWGDVPHNKIPEEVKQAAELGLPVPPRSRYHIPEPTENNHHHNTEPPYSRSTEG